MVAVARLLHRHQLILRLQVHGVEAAAADVSEVLQRRLLHLAQLRAHHQVVLRQVLGQTHHRRHPLLLIDGDEVDEGDAAGGAHRIRQLISLDLEATSTVGEKDEVVVGVSDEEVTDGIILARLHACDAATAAMLRTVGVQGQPLHVALGGQSDNHLLVRHQVRIGELLRLLVHDLRPAVIPKPLLDLLRVVPDEEVDLARIRQQVLQVGDLLDDLRVLRLDLLPLQAGQATKLHIQNSLSLAVAELERGLHQPLLRLIRRGRAPDRLDHLVQLVQRL